MESAATPGAWSSLTADAKETKRSRIEASLKDIILEWTKTWKDLRCQRGFILELKLPLIRGRDEELKRERGEERKRSLHLYNNAATSFRPVSSCRHADRGKHANESLNWEILGTSNAHSVSTLKPQGANSVGGMLLQNSTNSVDLFPTGGDSRLLSTLVWEEVLGHRFSLSSVGQCDKRHYERRFQASRNSLKLWCIAVWVKKNIADTLDSLSSSLSSSFPHSNFPPN